MAKRAYLVVTHGEFGIELIKSVEMIMGPQEDVTGFALRPGESVEDIKQHTIEAVEKNTSDGKESVILCDILGGSPSNVGMFLLSKEGVNHVITGVCMSMLISILSSCQESTKDLLDEAKNNAKDSIKLIDMDFIRKKS